MPDLGEAVDAALRARYGWEILRTPATHPRGLRARMDALERLHGSARRAAQAAGIGPSTWNHWKARHRAPSALNLRRLEAAYARDILGPRLRRAITRKGPPKTVTVTAVIRWSDSNRKKYNRQPFRTTTLDRLKRTDVAVVVDMWERFGGAAAGAALERVTTIRYGLAWPKDAIRFEGDQVHVTMTGSWT